LIDLTKSHRPARIRGRPHHVLLQGDITQEDYDAQTPQAIHPLPRHSAARNAQIALGHGFTALRDVETEGAMYADVDVKHAINNGEVPGPHMESPTRAMTPTGGTDPTAIPGKSPFPRACNMWTELTKRAKPCASKSVMGPDWIKYYSDHGYFYGPTESCCTAM